MIIGVPGAGINGVFYLRLTAAMPFRELRRTLAGRSSLARWRSILRLTSMAAAVALSLWGEYRVIAWAVDAIGAGAAGTKPRSHGLARVAEALAPSLVIAPFVVLGAVLLGMHALRLAVRPSPPGRGRRGASVVTLLVACGAGSMAATAGCARTVPVAVDPPEGYDFLSAAPSIRAEHDSLEDFYQLYFDAMTACPPGEAYGLALANQTIGLIRNDPSYIERARVLYAMHRAATTDPRQRERAGLGERYAGSLLTGVHPAGGAPGGDVEPVRYEKDPPPAPGFRRIVLGRSAIRVGRNATIKTQVDRVTRDWLLAHNVKRCPWAFTPESCAAWHEGQKLKELVDLAGARVVPVWGTKVTRIGERWFAPDAAGAPRFEISEDKVNNYPSTIVIDDHTAIVNDTHGVSAIAWDALDADLVVACGDHRGKMDAAYYLAERGVDVYVPTDRFLGALIGARTKATILGSAPIRRTADGAVIGDQSVTIDIDEPIVVSNAAGRYPLQYYDTPYRYFTALQEYCGHPLHIVPVEVKEYGKAEVVVDEARRTGARLIGIRVKSAGEHDAVGAWLAEDRSRRAVLFHTAAYPDGYKLFFEFPGQTSFGDIRPVFE